MLCTYRIIKEWTTCPTATKEAKVIEHEIYTEMKLFMHASGLKKTPGHKQKDTDIHIWKQYSKEYYNKRTCEWTRPFRCPMNCGCQAQVKLITREDYKRLEIFGTHDMQSHAIERSKTLSQIKLF